MRFNRIIVVNPPSPPGYVSNKDSMGGFGQLFPEGATLFPPLDLIYLASYLDAERLPVEVLECLAHDLDRAGLVGRIAASCAEAGGGPVLVVVRTSAPTLDWDMEVCGEIKARAGDVRLCVYGPVVSQVMGRVQREEWLDYLVAGDPDDAVAALVDGRPEAEIAGLSFRRDGAWVANGGRPFIKDLDKLPFPKWELLPYRKYRLPKSSASAELSFLPIWSSRGCPIGCHYCPYPVGQGLPWRARSAGNVADELERLVKELGIEYVLFRDPMFSLNQKRVLEICDEIGRRGLKFKWRCETRVDFLHEETLRAMAKAGCDGINFGVESEDVEIQANVGRRPITPEQFRQSFALCRELGIKTFAFFIIGLSGDTAETVLKTIKFAIDMRPSWVQFTAASPFIGTQLREWAVGQGLVTSDEYAYVNSHQVMIGNEHLTRQEVGRLLRLAQFIQNYLLNRKGILKDERRPSRLYRAAKSAADLAGGGAARAAFALARASLARPAPARHA